MPSLASPPEPRASTHRAVPTVTRVSAPRLVTPILSAVWPLARASLALSAVLLSSAGCLVTTTPTYDAPQQTPPMLVAAAAIPALSQVQYVTDNVSDPDLRFSASVISEDAGQDVNFVAFIDYGSAPAPRPFTPDQVFPADDNLPAGTLEQGPRATPEVQIPKFNFAFGAGPNDTIGGVCHTVTMMASHDSLRKGCPKCITDSSLLTWFVIRCPGDEGSTCSSPDVNTTNCGLLFNDWTGGCPIDNEEPDASTCTFQSLTGTDGGT
jgi:hypothetical protein